MTPPIDKFIGTSLLLYFVVYEHADFKALLFKHFKTVIGLPFSKNNVLI